MTRFARTRAPAIALLASVLLSACATDYVARTSGVRRAYERYDHSRAISELDTRVEEEQRRLDEGRHPDTLLFLLDRGMILHAAGNYDESNAVLHEAERVASSLDIVSVSEEATTLATTQRRRAYRGEDFELLLINVFKALNYAALGDREAALVEVRRVNHRLRLMAADREEPHEQLAIARYMGGVLWESAGKLDSAFIDYSHALERTGDLDHLVEPLLRLAARTGGSDVHASLLERYPNVPHEPLGPKEGQVVVVISAGLSPEKKATVHESEVDLLAVPYYQRRRWSRTRAAVRVGDESRQTVTVTSVEQVAVKHLERRIARMLGRSMAGAAMKAGLATGVGALTKSEDLGYLTFYLLMHTNRPDLRSWLSLPAEMQVARMRLPAGEHVVEVGWEGHTTRHPVVIRPGEITVLPLRRY